MTASLYGVVDGAWRAFEQAATASLDVLVRPSIPIAWFGDSAAYERSELRAVTVGLNPSRLEFPIEDRFRRFPRARRFGDGVHPDGHEEYVGALDDYFREDPYSPWFRPAFEQILLGMGASFYGSAPNTVLHTDLCSPVATDPTWSRLGDERLVLRSEGVSLWHDLIRSLIPDVIVASIARRYLDEIMFDWVGPWRVIHTIDRLNPYAVEARDLKVAPGKRTVLVFGRAANLPFGTVSTADKRAIGQAIRRDVDAPR